MTEFSKGDKVLHPEYGRGVFDHFVRAAVHFEGKEFYVGVRDLLPAPEFEIGQTVEYVIDEYDDDEPSQVTIIAGPFDDQHGEIWFVKNSDNCHFNAFTTSLR